MPSTLVPDPVEIFHQHESGVRSYCRSMPAVFERAINAEIWDQSGKRYIDFWAACGSLNFGHNQPSIKRAAIEYLENDGIVSGVDLFTSAKRAFLEQFANKILKPRRLDHVVQFTGPTGANSVEAAIKLARKITGRSTVAAFTRGFHGMSAGALAVTANNEFKQFPSPSGGAVYRLPYEGYNGATAAELRNYARMVLDSSGGLESPAAFIVECVQGEGGLNVASAHWLQTLARTAKELGALLIVDDVQAGCGRTGTYFSFDKAGITPDLVCLAKSIGGLGLPLALLLIKREYDLWKPGEHNGTFRGNNLAFVAATRAIEFGTRESFVSNVKFIDNALAQWCERTAALVGGRAKGIGAMRGVEFENEQVARRVVEAAFERGVLVERCGPRDEVLKVMPPLTTEPEILVEGLAKMSAAVLACIPRRKEKSARDNAKVRGSIPTSAVTVASIVS